MGSLLILTLFFLFSFKVIFKIFKINAFVFLGVFFVIKFIEGFIFDTSLGKWLRNFEERILNFEFFQYTIFFLLILETFFFFPRELELGVFDRIKVFFIRTLWIVLVWKGFFIMFSPEQIETFFDIVSIFVLFFTFFYVDIRSKLLNYKFLQLDTPFVLWSEIVAKLELLGDYRMTDKIKNDSIIMLLSFSRPQGSFPKGTNYTNDLSSQKRTMFGSFGRKIFNSFELETGRKFINYIAASGSLGGAFYQIANARDENDRQYRFWSSKLPSLEEDIHNQLIETDELTKKVETLKKETTKKFIPRLFSWVMGDDNVSSLDLELKSGMYQCDLAYKKLVISLVQKEAIRTALIYNREIHSFPFFRPLMDQHVLAVEYALKKDALVKLYLEDDVRFFKVIKIISEKIILEGKTPKQLAYNPMIQPFLLEDHNLLTMQDLPSVATCSLESSFSASFFKELPLFFVTSGSYF